MKKIFFYLFVSLFFTMPVFAQMSDGQVISYVKSEAEKGTSQQAIASQLIAQGVTQGQLERIKNQVNQQNQTVSSSTSGVTGSTLRTGLADETIAVQSSSGGSSVFGRNIFSQKNLTFMPNVNIPTPEDYKLGPGDEVVIDIWGASQASMRQTISPEGSIIVDRLGPVFLNGMTIKEANTHIQRKFSSLYAGIGDEEGSSQIKLTLGQIRTIQINIMGEVAVPGTYSISSLSSAFHALYNAGGINNIGSLRSIQLYRKGKLIQTIDIYKSLLEGDFKNDIRLMDNDVIIVPPFISLVHIQGQVKRPMVYEITAQETLADLIKYAGGFSSNAYTKRLNLARKTGEYDKVFTINEENYKSFILNDGDVISIGGGLGLFENKVEIRGVVFRPGSYEIGAEIKTVKNLIEKAGGIRENAFMDRATLTREKDDLTLENISFNLNDLLSGSLSDIELKKNDVLYIASNNVVLDLGSFEIYGQVVSPGAYRYAENTTIEDLILKAGGLLSSASMAKVDVARRIIDPFGTEALDTIAEVFTFDIKDGLIANGKSDFILQPYDQVYVRRSPGYAAQRNITINGEVLFAGTYALVEKSERISDVILRTGGLTKYAYPQGAKLIRRLSDEEFAKQKKSIRTIAERIDDEVAPELTEINRYYSIGIELDLALANPGSDYDLVLKPGDQLIIPEYDNTVTINGAVMYPNTVLYKKGKKVSHYVNQAGGYSDSARKRHSYIIYMNGTVAKAKKCSKKAIQPGCEVIVPTKEQKEKLTLPEILSLGTSVTSMASVVALLINALSN